MAKKKEQGKQDLATIMSELKNKTSQLQGVQEFLKTPVSRIIPVTPEIRVPITSAEMTILLSVKEEDYKAEIMELIGNLKGILSLGEYEGSK